MDIPISQSWIQVLLLASVRMTAFLVVAPPFAHHAIPARIKAMLGIGLGLAVSQRLSADAVPRDTAGFITAIVLELVTGLVLGFLVMAVFAAIQSAGSLIDLFSGFQMAQAFDPQMMVNGAQFTRLLQMAALALLFASDGYQLVIGGLTGSFNALPLAGGIDLSKPVDAVVGAITGMFISAVQIAGPLLVVLVLADVGLGLLTRVAPALNAFSLGFPLKIFITLALAGFLFLALPRLVASLAELAARTVLGVG
ncbi:flagellar biosynthetic protein FliR [Paenarthrobacter sp. NPDC089675]|uniref:flagellar biosynthetic protein FliR n=1 Tax=Paenarthrobacter sp. NPDC089675 TaxID=3364376 RepID=UPI0037F55BD4